MSAVFHTEAELSRAARGRLESLSEHCKVIKHNDHVNPGLADTSVNVFGGTTWFEWKRLKGDENVFLAFKPLQHRTLVELERATRRAWVVAWRYYPKQRQPWETHIYRPSALSRDHTPAAELWTLAPIANIYRALLLQTGAIKFAGVNHDALLRLIFQSHV